MSKSIRVMKIQFRNAIAAVERNLELAELQPAFEDKFLNQAVEADQRAQKLEAQIQ